MDHAVEADVDLAFPFLRAGVEESARLDIAGVVHQHVDPAEIADNRLGHGPDRLEVGDIRLVGLGLSPVLDNLADHAAGGVCRPVVVHGHGRALRGEGQRGLAADVPGAAGDQGNLAFQIKIHLRVLPRVVRPCRSGRIRRKSRSGVIGNSLI